MLCVSFNEVDRLVISHLYDFLAFLKILASAFVSFIFTFYSSLSGIFVAIFSLNGHVDALFL